MKVNADAGPTLAVPSAIGVPGEQTVWLRLIAAAVGQGQLENFRTGADVQVLLEWEPKTDDERKKTKNRSSHPPRDGNQREMKHMKRDKQRE